MGKKVSVGNLAAAIMEELEEYADLASDGVKQAVKNAGTTVRKEIQQKAPRKTGAYVKSWAVKNTKENACI